MSAEKDEFDVALKEALSQNVGFLPEGPCVELAQRMFTAKVIDAYIKGDFMYVTLEMPPIKYITITFTIEEPPTGTEQCETKQNTTDSHKNYSQE
jgi:hypothetical protein